MESRETRLAGVAALSHQLRVRALRRLGEIIAAGKPPELEAERIALGEILDEEYALADRLRAQGVQVVHV